MSIREVSADIYAQLKAAQDGQHVTQRSLAHDLGVPQPRLSEMEGRIKSGEVTKQMELLLLAADRLGLVPMLVPKDVVPAVKTVIQDYSVSQRIGRRSQFDQIWGEVAEEESRPIGFVLR